MITKDKLKKVYALALNGVEGEKDQAKELLDKLLKKYAVSIEELDEDAVQFFEFSYHGKEQRKLLIQTIYKVTDNPCSCYNLRYTGSQRICRTKLSAKCTMAQKIEIEFLFNWYCRIWEQEQKTLLNAFIQKHEIFGVPNDEDEAGTYSEDEIEKIRSMMKSLSDEQPYAQIEEKADD